MTSFRPWEHHQTGIHDLDDIPAPPEIQDLTELPHRPPQTGEPYTKGEILTYWAICDEMVDDAIDALDLLSPESGFSWYPLPKLEHQLIAIRHIQQMFKTTRPTARMPLKRCGRPSRVNTTPLSQC